MEAIVNSKIMQRNRISDFFKKEQKKLNNYVNKLIVNTSEIDSEDIIQDVMLKLFEKGDLLEPIENLSAYIYRSIRNKVIDTFRTRKTDISLDQEIDENATKLVDILHDIRYDTVSEIEQAEIKEDLYRCINSLNDQDKAIIIETEFEQKSFRELSEHWDIPIGTLLARKSRAIKKIHEMLNNKINNPGNLSNG